MLVHKGGKIKNWGGECRNVTPTKSLSQNIRVDVNRIFFFLVGGVRSGGGGGGQGGCERRIEVFVKIQKKKLGGGAWGSGGGRGRVGGRVDVIKELKFLGKFTQKNQGGVGFGGGGGGSGWGDQGGCE